MVQVHPLTPVPLREIWSHEARDFTRWLEKNLDYLGEAIGLTLEPIERESAIGDLAVDLLAEDDAGNRVIIECQLQRSDHEHLGKLLTYMGSFTDVKVAIWICAQPRPEHEKAVHWLNETFPVDTNIYLVQVEAYRIADSSPAVKFTVIAGPSEQSRQVGRHRKELAERHVLMREFWKQLIERLQGKTKLHANLKPSLTYWLSTRKRGIEYNYVVLKDKARVELYIDTGDGEKNKRIYDEIYKHKDAIEQRFGEPLEWQRLDMKCSCRVAASIKGKGKINDQDTWDTLQDAMIDAMIRLENAFAPYINQLQV